MTNHAGPKLFASSQERWRATAEQRRLYGGKTVTRFYIGEVGSGAETWKTVEGYGDSPGKRKTFALNRYRAMVAPK